LNSLTSPLSYSIWSLFIDLTGILRLTEFAIVLQQ
jgi:hypothetical protein